jgi:hypothetical protein
MKHKVVCHGITTHFKEVSINQWFQPGAKCGKNTCPKNKWYEPKDHIRDDVRTSNWSKRGFEMCALHVKNPLHS